MKTRREALSAGAAILGLPLAARATASQTVGADAEGSRMRIVCFEEHIHDPIVASAIQETLAAEIPYFFEGIGERYRDDPSQLPADRPRLTFIPESMKTAAAPLSHRIPVMDDAGIDVQVVSITNQPQLAAQGDALDLTRAANDRLAAAIAQHPDRFSAFFTLPWQDPDAAVREAERCVRDLKLPATMLSGRPTLDQFIDDARFEPVLAKLAELGAPLFIHPGPPLEAVRRPYYGGFNPEVTARLSLFGWGWHHEAGIQVIRLILSGVLDRNPDLKIISGHWGEMVPFYLQRMEDTMPPEATGLSRTIAQTYREQVWVHPSGMLDMPHFLFIREVIGVERIVFSIDYPYLTMSGARKWLENLPIPEAEKEAIAFRNAESLLRLS